MLSLNFNFCCSGWFSTVEGNDMEYGEPGCSGRD